MVSRLISAQMKKDWKSILLLGPRQVGKSTLIRELAPDLEINLFDDKTFLDFKSNPNELRELLSAGSPKSVFIDEIQRHPALLNTVQVILDSKEFKNKIKFYLSGSSARKLRRGQANLLPGRVIAYELGPLCAAELDYKLDVAKALAYGCLPEPYLGADNGLNERLLTTYSATYLREEIQAEALTRNLEGFSRFINTAAASSGQILDFSKMAKLARIERKNCVRFFEILEDTLIANRLDVFEPVGANITRRPKYYLFDNGVLNGLLENFNVSEDRKGMLFEHLVVNQILTSAKAKNVRVQLSYFRTRTGYEVDLILEKKSQVFAIEIKSGRVDESDAKKLYQFRQYFKKVEAYFLVVPNAEPRKIGEVNICDLCSFLKLVDL